MSKNVGKTDKIIRVVLAIILIGVAASLSFNMVGIILGIVALVLVGTAATGTCLAYVPLKISTCEKE